MTKNQSLDDLVKQEAIQFADQINKAAEFAEKEEEIRIAAERALAVIQKEIGITLRGRHEHTIGTGRADSVYGCVIIEYKNPHDPSARLSSDIDSPGNQKVIKQIQKRFSDFKQEYNVPLNTMFGVGCDGKYFIFIRCRDERWYVEDPVEVNRYSAERFLWALINMGTKGKAFAPEYLAGDFGSDSPLSHEGIKALYSTICSTSSPKAKVFFQQWKILFGEVCGYDVNTPSDKIGKLAEFYGIEGQINPSELLFSIHTYYSIFMKLLASEIVAFFHNLPTPLQGILKAPNSDKLKEEMDELERGGIFQHLKITNFLEGDLFAWYPDAWNDSIEKLIRDMAIKLDGYNPGTLSEEPARSRDLLKKLYQQLFPKSVRHDLGEYYTPDWLAEHVLNELGYEGDPNQRMLDPACGSGTFLVLAINKIKRWYDEHRDSCGFDEGGLARKILNNIVGFDLNPLAVMAARTNYLISMRDLIGRVSKVELPVYLCDSIMTPAEYGGLDTWMTGQQIKTKELKTSASNFKIPLEIAQDGQSIAKYAEQLEFCIRNGYDEKNFIEKCKNEGLSITANDLHKGLYRELVRLDKENKNGIWARIIKNAFAPLFCGKFDYIAGNPPWVNWENLPDDYRSGMKPLWFEFGLFSLSGMKGRLGGGKKDLSMLFTYAAIKDYLNEGKLGFLITQSVFKTKGAADGFRKFFYGEPKKFISIDLVHDLSSLKPFPGVANRTALIICSANTKTKYPVPYIKWFPKFTANIDENLELSMVKKLVEMRTYQAIPVNKSELTSQWLTAPANVVSALQNFISKSHFKAHAGVVTWFNSIYWVKILKKFPNDDYLIANLGNEGRYKSKIISGRIESSLLHPLVRGRNISRWEVTSNQNIIFTQDPSKREGISLNYMKNNYPLTYSFLKNFEDILSKRPMYIKNFVKGKKTPAPFYTVFGVGNYTLSPYKVVWAREDKYLRCAVLSSDTIDIQDNTNFPIPDQTVMFIPFDDEVDAYATCAILNSTLSVAVPYAYTTDITTHILEYIPIKKILESKRKELFELSKKCYILTQKGDKENLKLIEEKIDMIVAEACDISNEELQEIVEFVRKDEKKKNKEEYLQNEQKSVIRYKTIKEENNNQILKEKQFNNKSELIQDKLSSETLMHLSHKAKYNDMLSSKQRGALFSLARLKSRGAQLTAKQISYLETIIKEAIDQGIIEAKCNHHKCDICEKVKEIFNK